MARVNCNIAIHCCPRPSCSKLSYLNELVSGQNVICSSKYNISFKGIFAEKKVSSFCKCKSCSHFFSKNISINAIFNDQSFKDMLTNNIEQLGPVLMFLTKCLIQIMINLINSLP